MLYFRFFIIISFIKKFARSRIHIRLIIIAKIYSHIATSNYTEEESVQFKNYNTLYYNNNMMYHFHYTIKCLRGVTKNPDEEDMQSVSEFF